MPLSAFALVSAVHRCRGKLSPAEEICVCAVVLGRLLPLSATLGSSFSFILLAAPALGPVATMEVRLLIAGVILLTYAAISWSEILDGGKEAGTRVAGMLALGVICTAAACPLCFRRVVNVGPVKTLTVTFPVQIFGVLWGWLLLGEPITPSKLVLCADILLGIALVTGLPLRLPCRVPRFAADSGAFRGEKPRS